MVLMRAIARLIIRERLLFSALYDCTDLEFVSLTERSKIRVRAAEIERRMFAANFDRLF